MKFINFQKWMEEATMSGSATVSASSAPPSTSSNSSGGTLKGDVAKVPTKLGCVNCSKDFKNWYHKRRKRK